MNMNINELFQKNLDKITKALNDSNFFACVNLSNEMLRIADYLDFADAVFIGEFFESLFMNLDSTYRKYIIDDKTLNILKEEITNLISKLKSSLPPSDEEKVDLYNSMTKIRATVTKLQLESFRGEVTKKKSRGISKLAGEHIGELFENLEEPELDL